MNPIRARALLKLAKRKYEHDYGVDAVDIGNSFVSEKTGEATLYDKHINRLRSYKIEELEECEAKNQDTMFWIVYTIAGAFLVIPTIIILWLSSPHRNSEQGKPSQTGDKVVLENEGQGCQGSFNRQIMPVQNLVIMYSRNPIKFDSTFKGKCVTVYGSIQEMGTTLGYDITLAGVIPSRTQKCEPSLEGCRSGLISYTSMPVDPNMHPKVVVSIPEDNASSLANFRVGIHNAAFLGRLTSIVDGLTISITDARLVNGSPFEKDFRRMEDLFREKGGQNTVRYDEIKN